MFVFHEIQALELVLSLFFFTRILMWSYRQYSKVTPNFPNIWCYYGVLKSFFIFTDKTREQYNLPLCFKQRSLSNIKNLK